MRERSGLCIVHIFLCHSKTTFCSWWVFYRCSVVHLLVTWLTRRAIFFPAVERELAEALVRVDDSDTYREKTRLPPSRAERCLCFQRTVSNLTKFLDRAKVGKFVDLSPNTNCIDVKTHKSAWRIRNAIYALLGNDAIFHESVMWNDPEGIDAHEHTDYLERMCDEFYNRTRETVDQQMARRCSVVSDPFYEDIVQNWQIARQHCDRFLGRDALLERIRHYVVNETNQALVIHGDPGTGNNLLTYSLTY